MKYESLVIRRDGLNSALDGRANFDKNTNDGVENRPGGPLAPVIGEG